MGTTIVQFGDGAEATASLEQCGGKAVNLIRLASAGLRVPPGFVLTTAAYRSFVAENQLTKITTLGSLDPSDTDSLEAASTRIRAAFAAGQLSDEVRDRIATAAAPYADGPVAVRSSATAEDLPELSFAGQQDTYLNVIGTEAIVAAVVDCWSSLWTARAIGYRVRAEIPHEDAALAVVVQRMVTAEVSGVMFTADPLDGRRDRVVIDATHGLGEALVSGLVEPDHFVVGDGGLVLERTKGAKAVATIARPGGGVETVANTGSGLTLSDPQLVELAALGRRVEAGYGTPQDIEWAFADGRLYVLQSRAVTSLYPLPDPAAGPGESEWGGFAAWLSFGSMQGMLEPITPIGQDALILLARGASRLFGAEPGPYSLTGLPFLRVAGERLWARADHALRTELGRRILPAFVAMADPAAQALLDGLDEPRLREDQARGTTLTVIRAMAPFLRQLACALPTLVRDPVRVRNRLERECERLVEAASARESAAGAKAPGAERLNARLDAMATSLESAFPVLLPRFGPIMAPTALAQRRLVALGGSGALATLRATPGNVTTEMDLDLWRVAEAIRADPESRSRFAAADPDELAADFKAGRLPIPVTIALTGFLQRWGMRGVGEIDLGHPRWADDPTGALASLRSYVVLGDDTASPAAAYARGAAEAAEALDRLTGDLSRRGPRGRLDARQVGFLVSRVRATFGARETPKFTIVRMLWVVRKGLLACGEELAAAGRLQRGDDILMLHVAELRNAWTTDPDDLRGLVAERRAAQQREARRRQVPRLMLGDGRTFYEGIADPSDGSIGGSPVSPGVAEGTVRVVLSPTNAGLLPGEILVCPGTDPAWTPLFLVAAGLVTEVGGMMTHGSVVAREYGLPAVVGVHDATTRLRTGMRVRLDGFVGTITVLDDSPGPA